MVLEVGDLVLCTVDRIVGTEVFVKIDNYGEGGIVMSEVAPGRIRNLRDYIVPKKRIVCKVLKVYENGNVDLSLRRVSQKERKEVIEKDKQEKSYLSIIKSMCGDKFPKIIQEITKQEDLFSFFERAKEQPKILENIFDKESANKLIEILKTQKNKKIKIKKEIHLTTINPQGIFIIKKLLNSFEGVNIKYISAGKYLLEVETQDAKSADKKLKEMISKCEKSAKKLDAEFLVK